MYAQLRDQIVQAIGRGALQPAAQLPTVREVAVALRVNPNTVNRAYIELEREGVLITARGRGTFVADGARRAAPSVRQVRLREIAHRAVAESKAAGFDPSDLLKAIDVAARKTQRR